MPLALASAELPAAALPDALLELLELDEAPLAARADAVAPLFEVEVAEGVAEARALKLKDGGFGFGALAAAVAIDGHRQPGGNSAMNMHMPVHGEF